jgi:Glycosyl transferases group 1
MRIFLSCQQALRPHAVPAYAFWEHYFRGAFAEAGHELLEAAGVDWAEGLTALGAARRGWLDTTWTTTLKFIRSEHQKKPIDVFLGYLFPDQVEPDAIRQIRALGIPCVNFFCDNVREFTKVPESFAGFDLHWVPEFDAKAMYERASLPYLYAPMPVWISPESRIRPQTENEEVMFAGSHDDLREALLDEAVALGLGLTLYGSGWNSARVVAAPPKRSLRKTIMNQVEFLRKEGARGIIMRESYRRRARSVDSWASSHAKAALVGEDYFQRTRESRVVIGINRYPSFRSAFSSPGRYSRLRDIEAPMLGACYLTERAPGLEDLYELGVEIETYGTAAELVEQTARLGRDAAKRRSLRERGQRRALSEHTIARSLERMAAALGSRK